MPARSRKALSDSGAKIVDRGNPDPHSFAYTIQNIEGRAQVSGRRLGEVYYSLDADLTETGK